MRGKELRLAKLFSGGENAVVVAVDHGQTFGPMPGLEDFPTAVQALRSADGVLLPPAMVDHSGKLFLGKRAPTCIVRLNWTSALCLTLDYEEAHTVPVVTPQQAMALGAEVVLANLTLQSGSEMTDADNIGLFGDLAQQADEAGIPLIGEVWPPKAKMASKEELHEYVKWGCRIAAEMGADLIKTYYTGERFPEAVAGTPIPVLALGAEKTPKEIQALELAYKAVQAGAKGVVFGRNVLQAKDPSKFLAALKEVTKRQIAPQEAAAKHGLE